MLVSFSKQTQKQMCYNSVIDWHSRKQTVVARSTAESEYIAAAETAVDLLGVKRLLEELKMIDDRPITIFEDNQPCIQIANSNASNKRVRHLELPLQALRTMVKDKLIKMVYCPTDNMAADALTKPVGSTAMSKFKRLVGLGNRY